MTAPSLPSLNRKIELGRKAIETLKSFGCTVPYGPNAFNLTDEAIIEPTSCSSVSDQILDRIFSRSETPHALHYTNADAFKSIISNKTLWLAWVQKNIADDELRLLIPNRPTDRKFPHEGETYIAVPLEAENDMCRLQLVDVY
jgi:hypothetical protein